MTDLDTARRAYEAAKRISAYEAENGIFQSDACVIKAIATTTYEAALLADAQRKLDAMGVVIDGPCGNPAGMRRIKRLAPVVSTGRVQVIYHAPDGWDWLENIHPYVAPVVKEMVLYGSDKIGWAAKKYCADAHRLTLSGITPADLDGMTGRITGTYTVERL